MAKEWYTIDNVQELDSPVIAIYPDRVKENIKRLVASIDDVKRLRPHIKTHKSAEVSLFMLDAGITKFKCATIAEAEMLGSVKAPDVLLAYQPVGPKAARLCKLVDHFPSTVYSCLIDDFDAAKNISDVFEEANKVIPVFIDLNVGMNRTGITPENALELFEHCQSLKGIRIVGLHAYDGHLRDNDFALRTKKCDEAFARVVALKDNLDKKSGRSMIIVAGGTPTFSIHSKRKSIECSPGTYIYWDKGYEEILREQKYLFAALVVTRVISIPTSDTICVDLGHKAIAAENPLGNRVRFINAPNLQPTGQSEEHLVLKVEDGKQYSVGDILYGVPYHVCPTIALHDRAAVIEDNKLTQFWNNFSRNRTITI